MYGIGKRGKRTKKYKTGKIVGSMLKRMGEWQRIPGNKEFNTKKE